MKEEIKAYEQLVKDFEELSLRYNEVSETLQAIRTGQVDALMVHTESGPQLYTLRSADHTYRVFIEKMKEGAITLNRDGVIVYCNSQFASMVDLPLCEVIGRSFSHFIAEACRAEFNSLMEKGWSADSRGEIIIKNNKDRIIPVILSFTSLELDEGVALSVILTDLTIQKETESQLKLKNQQLEEARQVAAAMNRELEERVRERTSDLLTSREYFKFLADNIPVMIWTADKDGKLDYVNRRWYEYTGFSLEDSKTMQAQLVHPDDLETSSASWRRALKNKEVYEQQFRFKRITDEDFRWHYTQAIPFRDEHNNVTAWIGTSIDIDDQKKALERKDEFISVASHELRTPLTSLKGYMQLMEYVKDLPDEAKSYISKANVSLNKLQRLIDELLDASKIKAGKLEFSKLDFNLSELIKICVENSGLIYPSYAIRNEAETEIFVNGNQERIEQVLMNLINNAVKYSPENREVIVRATTEEGFVTVSVIDFGVGMSEADQKLVFQRFYRVNENKFLTPGLGMGLYIASEIIKEHDGEIRVHSKLNEGSVFSFSLPLVDVAKHTNAIDKAVPEVH